VAVLSAGGFWLQHKANKKQKKMRGCVGLERVEDVSGIVHCCLDYLVAFFFLFFFLPCFISVLFRDTPCTPT
jgi:hypothetical protein